MFRKWDKVDLGYETKREQTPKVMATVRSLLNSGCGKREIIRATGYTDSRVGWAIKKIGLPAVADSATMVASKGETDARYSR